MFELILWVLILGALYGFLLFIRDSITLMQVLVEQERKAWQKCNRDRLNAEPVDYSRDALIYSGIDIEFPDPCDECKVKTGAFTYGCSECKVGTEKQRCKVCEVPQSALDEEARLRMESERA